MFYNYHRQDKTRQDKNKRFNYRSYKDAIKLAGDIFSRGITLWFGNKKYTY